MNQTKPKPVVAIDTETTGLSPWHGHQPFLVSACFEDGETLYWQWPVDPVTRKVNYEEGGYRGLKHLLEDPQIDKVFHNAKFDLRMLETGLGITTAGTWHDTMLLAHLHSNLETTFKLKVLAEKYLNYPMTDEKELKDQVRRARTIAKNRGWSIADSIEADYWLPTALGMGSDLVLQYAVGDVERTMLLYQFYMKLIQEDPYHREEYQRECQLLRITYEMETRGMCVMYPVLEREITHAQKTIDREYSFLRSQFGEGFNPNSPVQLAKLFFTPEGRGYTPESTTEKGFPQVNGEFLRAHLDDPVCYSILRLRKAEKAISGFFGLYKEMAIPLPAPNDYIGVLHASFSQLGPKTGRYSCRNPNLQQVSNPVTSPKLVEAEQIQARRPFCPRPDCVWLTMDYSQLEVRIFASIANEKLMCDAIRNGRDLHNEVGNRAFGGVDNPAALRTAKLALELDAGTESSSEWVAEEKIRLGYLVDGKVVRDSTEVAREWLEEWDGNIVAAEKSIHKENARNTAKQLTFNKLYGGGPRAVMQLIPGTSYDEAVEFLSEYDRAFPAIGEYMRELSREASLNGYIVNPLGRKLYVPQDYVYRCVNYMVQGSAASLLKWKMREIHHYIQETGISAWLLLNLHDELIVEVEEKSLYPWFTQGLKRIMEDTDHWFNIPMEVEIALVTESWNEKDVLVL